MNELTYGEISDIWQLYRSFPVDWIVNFAHDIEHATLQKHGIVSTTQEINAPVSEFTKGYMARNCDTLKFVIDRWNAEVKDRPLRNRHRRSMDDTYRQIVKFCGANPDALLGKSHDTLLAEIGIEAQVDEDRA